MAHSMIDVHAESYNLVCICIGHAAHIAMLSETSDLLQLVHAYRLRRP